MFNTPPPQFFPAATVLVKITTDHNRSNQVKVPGMYPKCSLFVSPCIDSEDRGNFLLNVLMRTRFLR